MRIFKCAHSQLGGDRAFSDCSNFIGLCVCASLCMRSPACHNPGEGSEDNLQRFLLSFYQLRPGDWTRVPRPGSKHLSHWAIWLALSEIWMVVFKVFLRNRNWHLSLKIYAEGFRSDVSSRLQLTQCSRKNCIHVCWGKWSKCDQNGTVGDWCRVSEGFNALFLELWKVVPKWKARRERETERPQMYAFKSGL